MTEDLGVTGWGMKQHPFTRTRRGDHTDDSGGKGAARVLVVDDRATNRRIVRTVLAHPRFEVTEAIGGKEALALLVKGAFDLVILDVLMPEMSGLEVLRRIREQYTESELPVIMATAKNESTDVVAALELGANEYVVKPVDLSVLAARVRTQLSRKRAEDGLREAHDLLERRVEDRTAELIRANAALKAEIWQRGLTEKALRASEERFRTLYDDNPSMYFTLDVAGTILSANEFGAAQLGYAVDELLGRPASVLYAETDAGLIRDQIERCLRSRGTIHRWEAPKLRKDGTDLWARETGRAVEDFDGNTRLLIVCENITEARKLSEQLSYQTSHDALTGLINRRAFSHRLQRVLGTARLRETEHALCYVDLDQFKLVNESCGHVAGDELLRQLSGFLPTRIRRRDTLARLGGDEFGVLMEHCSLKQARRVANALRTGIEDFRFVWEGNSFSIGASMGLVPITGASMDVAEVLTAADSACYAAKDKGRNRIHVYRADDTELARRQGEMQWAVRLNHALEQSRFHLNFQPITQVSAGAPTGAHYELLLSMEDESGRLVHPGTFLPAAERYNLVPRIDRWVVEAALTWLTRHPRHLKDLRMCSINLSGQSLSDDKFLRFVTFQFEQTKIPADKICFEVTETAAIANLAGAIRFIKTLKGLGCAFALDDFGSGLSSFGYLKALPLDYLKIDGAFVKNIVEDPIDFAMVRSINEIGKVMGKQTIAEFVENDAILEKLRAIGVDYAQGNAIGVPRPIEELATTRFYSLLAS